MSIKRLVWFGLVWLIVQLLNATLAIANTRGSFKIFPESLHF